MTDSPGTNRGRNAVKLLITVCVSVAFSLFLAEVILRVVPIPGIRYNIAKYDDLVGTGCYPNSTAIYSNARGDYAKRHVNRWGYLDKDHEPVKSDGVYRIGFFGDSFTQAVQVPFEETFVSLAQGSLSDRNVECLSFGVSGFSTLQSYLTSQKWSRSFDLDLIVYAFSENDLGDQIREIKGSPNVPYAYLTPGGFGIDNSFRERNRYKEKLHFRIFDYIGARSLVFTTVRARAGLLAKYGVKLRVTREDMELGPRPGGTGGGQRFPSEGDFPSTWPDSLRAYAQDLGAAIIRQWRSEVEDGRRGFVILYIPRMALEEPFIYEDSWKPWLENLSREDAIELIDPSAELLDTALQGKDIIYDHLTRDGHVAVANAFVDWFRGRL